MGTHYLFLDEVKASDTYKYFCLGGLIISKESYETKLVPEIRKLKKEILNDESIILHEAEIRKAKHPYRMFKNEGVKTAFWERMNNIFSEPNIFHTVACAINCNEYKRIYAGSSQRCDEYFIALQIIMENFAYYLEDKNGSGAVYIESRTPTDDERLSGHFHNLKAHGTLFLKNSALQKRIHTISFPQKIDNVIGLQVADFIPNPISRHCTGIEQKTPSLFTNIEAKLYHGSVNMPERFGLKIIP